jgi:hypothetical protein
MPNVNNGAILEVIIHSTLAAQRQMTVLHYLLSDLGAPADQFSFLETVDDRLAAVDGIYTAIANVSGNDCEFQEVQLQWVHPFRYAYRRFASMPLIGQAPDACYPPNVAATITKKGEEAGRHSIGSVHLPNMPNNTAADGKWGPAMLALLTTLAGRLKAPFTLATPGTITPIIFNKAAPADSKPVFSTVVQPEVRVQRRRTVGLGI